MTKTGEKYPMSSSLIYIGQQETNLHYPRNSVLPKQQVKDEKKGSFRAPSESESESDNSQKPDNLFKDSVTFKRNATATVPELYPFSELGFSAITEEPDSNLEYIPKEETRKPEPEYPDLSNSSNTPSLPYTHFFKMKAPPSPPPAPAAHMPSGLLRDSSEFRSKRKDAHTLTDNLETYSALSSARIATDNKKVLLALNKISDEPKLWKRNKVTTSDADLTSWHNWNGINTTPYSNWEEVDTSGTAYIRLQHRKNKRGKKKRKLSDYIKSSRRLSSNKT